MNMKSNKHQLKYTVNKAINNTIDLTEMDNWISSQTNVPDLMGLPNDTTTPNQTTTSALEAETGLPDNAVMERKPWTMSRYHDMFPAGHRINGKLELFLFNNPPNLARVAINHTFVTTRPDPATHKISSRTRAFFIAVEHPGKQKRRDQFDFFLDDSGDDPIVNDFMEVYKSQIETWHTQSHNADVWARMMVEPKVFHPKDEDAQSFEDFVKARNLAEEFAAFQQAKKRKLR